MYVSKRKTAYDVRIRDWRSDVCSSDRHEIIIGLLRIEGRDPFAVGGAPAHEADRFVEDIDVIARAFQEHPVIGVLAKLLRIERERIIVPRIFERLVRARLRSEEHTSELQSLMRISYAVFCLKKKNNTLLNPYYIVNAS